MAAIEKRGTSSYRLTVSLGYSKEGKKQFKKKTLDLSHIPVKKREEEAKKQFVLFENEVKKGLFVDNEKITFEEFIQKWLKDYAESTLAPKTLYRYKEILNGRIIPALGHIKLIQLQPTHLTAFYNNLRENGVKLNQKYAAKNNFSEIIEKHGLTLHDILIKSKVNERTISNIKNHKNIQSSTATNICKSINIKIDVLFDKVSKDEPLSERTILHHHRLISTILACAVQWGFLINNPAARIKAPKVIKSEARHYDIEEVEYILQLIENEPIKYRTMVTLALYGGMREGELTALTWDDIDTDNCLVRLNKALQHLPEEGTFEKTTKTENSRIISIPPSAITLLKEYKKWQNEEKLKLGTLWIKTDRLFTGVNGGNIFPSTISKWFLNFIRNHNKSIMNNPKIKEEDKEKYLVREVNFHGLRHTSATVLINQNVDVSTVSKRLGHARTSTTMDIYSHSLQKADTMAADKFENLFNKKSQNVKQV